MCFNIKISSNLPKSKINPFFAFFGVPLKKNSKIFDSANIETHIQGTTMKLTSWGFRKCGSFCASEFLNGSYRCSKLTDCEILGPLPKIRGLTEKRHGHNNEFWALPLNQRGTNHVGPTLIQWQRSKLNIVAVSFFRSASFQAIFFSEFDLTLTANNYGLKPSNLEN